MGAWTRLNEDLDAWLGRHSPTDLEYLTAKPTIIREAQKKVYREFRLDDFNTEILGTCTAGQSFIARPTAVTGLNFLSVAVNGNSYTPLSIRDVAWIASAFTNRFINGPPRYYAVKDEGSIQLAPTPDQDYPYRLGVQRIRAILSDSTEDTPLSDDWYFAILQAAIVEGARFAQEDKRVQLLEDAKEAYGEQLRLATGVQTAKSIPAEDGGPTQG